jgi:hypothetical protein
MYSRSQVDAEVERAAMPWAVDHGGAAVRCGLSALLCMRKVVRRCCQGFKICCGGRLELQGGGGERER